MEIEKTSYPSKKTLSTITTFDKNTIHITNESKNKNGASVEHKRGSIGFTKIQNEPGGKIKGMITDLELM